MKKIYILSSCNEYKEYSSMRLVAAATSIKKSKALSSSRSKRKR